MKMLSPVVRLTMGVLLLTISLLLTGDLLGLIPDKQKNLSRERQFFAETIALQTSIALAKQDYQQIDALLQLIKQRNENIQSIGIRSVSGQLMASVGEHQTLWTKAADKPSNQQEMAVPLHDNNGRFGLLEIRFGSAESTFLSLFSGNTVLGIVLFVLFAGFFAYWLFLKRALRELDPSSVVPDRVKNALDTLSEGLVILDRSGLILFSNRSFIEKAGLGSDQLMGIDLSSLDWELPEGSEAGSYTFPWQQLLQEQTIPKTSNLKLKISSQGKLSLSVNVAVIENSNGDFAGGLVTFSDMTELEQSHQDLARVLDKLKLSQKEIAKQNQELQILASYDPLTGILNRRAFFEGFNHAISEIREEGGELGCLMVDIDHFKMVNDQHGHATGDKAIKAMAEALTSMTRPEDLAGRYGGEEFCIVLRDMDKEQSIGIAERIRLEVADIRIPLDDGMLSFTASFGVSRFTGDHEINAEAIVDQADQALYAAKEQGRNRVIHWQNVDDLEVLADPAANGESEPGSDVKPETETVIEPEAKHQPNDSEQPMLSRIKELEALLSEEKSKRYEQPTDVDEGDSRIVLIDRIRQAAMRCDRVETKIALLYLGTEMIDRIRGVFGFQTTEKLIRLISERIKETLPDTDTLSRKGLVRTRISVSRFNQSEFVLLLNNIDSKDDVNWVVQLISSAFKDPFLLEGVEVPVQLSFGASVFPGDGEDAEELLSKANAALLETRMLGVENCTFYSDDIHLRLRQQLSLNAGLRSAIEDEGLLLEYLPQVDIQTGKITGAKALLRWNHPELGMVDPEQFIAVAETSGMVHELSSWVLEVASKQLKSWINITANEALIITINLTASQLRNPQLSEQIIQVVNDAGLKPQSLRIDLSESQLLDGYDEIIGIQNTLRKLGVGFALDDFGTGHSSMASLRDFDVDWVKIAPGFTAGLNSNPKDSSIVATIITMAHNLGASVVAEGVKDSSQLAVLKSLGCDEAQGSLYSRLLSKNEMTELLSQSEYIEVNAPNDLQQQDCSEARNDLTYGVINHLAETEYH